MVSSVSNSSSVNQSSSTTTSSAKKSLDQEGFLKLLTMQLSYQDPFKPVENAEMLSQMASMSTSEGISNLSGQMETLNSLMTSSQALEASALVGQEVLTGATQKSIEQGEAVSGVLVMGDGATNVHVSIEDSSGQVVRQLVLDGKQSGNVPFEWDGNNANGDPVKKGTYQFKVSGTVEGQSESFNALVYSQVESVTLGNSSNPSTIKLKGIGSVYLSDILEIAGSGSSQSTQTQTAAATTDSSLI